MSENANVSNQNKLDNRTKNKKPEVLSEWELKELMGTNRDRYKRVKGAVRRT